MTVNRTTLEHDAEREAPQQTALDRETTARAIATGCAPELERLAALEPIEYDRQRKAGAEKLGIRVDTLDKEIQRLQGDQATNGQGRTVTFIEPEPWPHPVDGAVLLDELARIVRRYVVLPAHGAEALALWIVLTYLANDVSVLPLLVLLSPEKGCGKTTAMEILFRLCWRARTTSNIQPAGLFRFIEMYQPTFLIDEGDSFLRGSDELRGMINSGHTRVTATVIRCVGQDFEPREFSTWCPKALAAIGNLPETIEDRAVILRMRRKGPGESVASIRQAGQESFEDLKRKSRRFADDYGQAIACANPALPPTLNNRSADNWEPLCAIADAAGGNWPALSRAAAVSLTPTRTGDSLKTTLLADIRDLFRSRGTNKMASADIIAALVAMEERPWSEAHGGKPITTRQLGKWLSEFGISSGTIRVDAVGTPKGYRLEQFEDAFGRYLPTEAPQRHNQWPARGLDSIEAPSGLTGVADRIGV